MEITFQNNLVLPKLNQAASVVSNKPAVGILSSILVETKNSKMILTASNNDVALSVAADVDNYDTEMRFCVECSDLLKGLRNLGDVPVTMILDDASKSITCKYGNGRFSIPYTDATEFPFPNFDVENSHTHTLGAERLLTAIAKTDFAVASDELRPIMNGLHFDFKDGRMIVVATDGHKMVKYCDAMETGDEASLFNLPAKTASVVKSLLSGMECDVRISFDDSKVIFSNKYFRLVSTLPEGRYPSYDKVIPATFRVEATIDREAFQQALKRVLPMGSASSELCTLRFEMGVVTISTEDLDFSKSASEYIECDYAAEPMVIGFKGSALLQVISNIDNDTATLQMTQPNKSCIIYGKNRDEHLALIMPMLVN